MSTGFDRAQAAYDAKESPEDICEWESLYPEDGFKTSCESTMPEIAKYDKKCACCDNKIEVKE